MSILKILSLVFVLLFLSACSTQQVQKTEEQNEVVIYEFYSKGCSHCVKLNNWLEDVKPRYPALKVVQHEVGNNTNRIMFRDMAKAYGKNAAMVPSIFIGEKNIVGFSAEIGEQIEAEIQSCLNAICNSPLEKINSLK